VTEYALIKLVHLGALVLWLGPAFGAWLILRAVENNETGINAVTAKVSRVFFLIIALEHVAFGVLLATGLILGFHYGWAGTDWFKQKLFIVLVLIVPLELVDIALGNWLAANAAKKRYAGQPLQRLDRLALDVYHGVFTKIALVIIPLSVMTVMFLAISKVSLF
jgi:uncharacterized membrane protein